MAAQQETKKLEEVVDKTVDKKEEDELDAIIGEIESMNQEVMKPNEVKTAKKSASVTPIRSKTANTGTESQSLKLELTGSLNLRLAFSSGSKSIDLICQDDALICRFADGTEFRIPIQDSVASDKKAA